MKRAFLLIASAALLFAGCRKEQIAETQVTDEGIQTVTFTVGVASEATKAVLDNDGYAANVNHWIMQVLDSDDDVYNYQEEDGTVGVRTHTFKVPLIKGQTYKVMFWADTKNNYVTVGQEKITDLRNITRAEDVALVADRDDLDAFSAVVTNFTTTQATQQNITLKRPFAQLNVVFTDLKKLYEAMGSNDTEYAKFKPTDFVAKAKVPTTFNVLTQTAGAPSETALEVNAATDYLGNYTSHRAQETLYMDYFFASKDTKDIVDIDFSFVSKGVTIAHDFRSIPFQRNYRTNIVGELMSAEATWNVIIDPEWDGEYLRGEQATATSIAEINAVLAQGTTDVIVTGIADDDPDNTIYLPKSNEGKKNITITFPATTKDLKIEYKEGTETYCPDLNVKAETMSNIEINLPNSHVELLSGEFTAVKAATSISTIVVRGGVVVESLTVTEGAVKIYGTVNSVIVNKAEGKDVAFYNCYGISSDVKEAIAAYAGVGYVFEQVGEKWNLVPTEITPEGCEIEGHTAVVEPEATVVVIPEGVTEVVDENGNWPFSNNNTVESITFPSTVSVDEVGGKTCQALGGVDGNGYASFGNCNNLNTLILEGGCDMYIAGPLLPWGGAIKNILIRNLPTSLGFAWGCADNAEVNPILFYQQKSDTQKYSSDVINIYLPAGWVAADYQYKFSAANTSDLNETVPPVKVWEKNAQGEYVLLGTGTKCQGNNKSIWTPAGEEVPGGEGEEQGGEEGGQEQGGEQQGEEGGQEQGGEQGGQETAESALPVTINWNTASGCTVSGNTATISDGAQDVVIPEGVVGLGSVEENNTIKSLALSSTVRKDDNGVQVLGGSGDAYVDDNFYIAACPNMENLYIEGGNSLTFGGTLVFGGGLKNVYIQKLPTSAPAQSGVYALFTDFGAHLQSSVFELSKYLIDSVHKEGVVAYTS